MAWTKQWWSSGVHLKRGTFDLIYCLTAPLLPQLPILQKTQNKNLQKKSPLKETGWWYSILLEVSRFKETIEAAGLDRRIYKRNEINRKKQKEKRSREEAVNSWRGGLINLWTQRDWEWKDENSLSRVSDICLHQKSLPLYYH